MVSESNGAFSVSSGSNVHVVYYANPSWSLSFPLGTFGKVLIVEKEGFRPVRLDFNDWQVAKAREIRHDVSDHRDRRMMRVTYFLKPIPLSCVRFAASVQGCSGSPFLQGSSTLPVPVLLRRVDPACCIRSPRPRGWLL